MPGSRKPQGKLIPIGTLAKLSGVSVQTIHYYIREGLLEPPTKTSRNMAYYDPQCVDEIRFIKELQNKRFLPLAVIKTMIQAKRKGQEPQHVAEMGMLFDSLFHPIGLEAEPQKLSFAKLATTTGCEESDLKKLEDMGLLMPQKNGDDQSYDDIDVNIVKIVQKLFKSGLTLDDLKICKSYIKAIRIEAKAIHQKGHQLHDTNNLSITKLIENLNTLKTYLILKIYRQEIVRPHPSEDRA